MTITAKARNEAHTAYVQRPVSEAERQEAERLRREYETQTKSLHVQKNEGAKTK